MIPRHRGWGVGRSGVGRRGVVAASLGAFAVVLAVVLPATPAGATPGPGLAIGGVDATGGQLRFVVAAHDLPAGVALDGSSLTVEAGGVALPATVEPYGSAGARPATGPPQRGVMVVVDGSAALTAGARTAVEAAATAYGRDLPADVALGLVTAADKPVLVVGPSTDRAGYTPGTGAAPGDTPTTAPSSGPTTGPSSAPSTAPGAAPPASRGAALYDALAVAGAQLGQQSDLVDRRIVVISGGGDAGSTAGPAELATTFATAGIRLDVLVYGAASAGAALTELATGTGGRLTRAPDVAALTAASATLAAALPGLVVVTAQVPPELAGKTGNLTVTLSSAGTAVATATAGSPVTFGQSVDAAASTLEKAKGLVLPRWVLIVGLVSVGVALMVGAFIPIMVLIDRSVMRRRVKNLGDFTGERVAKAQAVQPGNAVIRTALSLSEKAVQNPEVIGRIEANLDQGGIELRPAEWVLLRTGSTVAGAFLLMLVLPWYVGVIGGGLVGWALPGLFRRFRATRRMRRFADLLPESLQLVVGALRSGFSLPQAIDALVREGPEPVASEFGRAVAQMRLGGDLEDALERCATRNNSKDLSFLVMAIRIQREVGGNLSEVLETTVETMRERGRIQRHVRALSAEGRLSAYVLIGLPIVLGAFMFLVRNDYVRPLYTEPLGIMMLCGGVGMLVAGSFWMSKLVKVDV